MKYFLNILFTAILSIGILPFYSLNTAGGEEYIVGNGGYTQCHCEIHKSSKNNRVAYIIDCNSSDKHIISGTAQIRTSVLIDSTTHNNPCVEFSYIPFTTKVSAGNLTTDTPPPKIA